MQRTIRLFALSLILVLLTSNFVQAAGAEIPIEINKKKYDVIEAKVEVNGFPLKCEFSPYIDDSRTFVPIRELTELMGATVDWDQSTRSVKITLQDQTVKLRKDSNVVYVNGEKKILEDTSIPRLAVFYWPRTESKTMVPLRFLSESFGFNVEWDQDTRTASIWNIEAPKIKSSEPSEGIDELDITVDDDENNSVDNLTRNNGSTTVVVDAGHGGHDSGALGADNKTKEKDLNLTVARKLAGLLRNAGFNVIETRTRDEYVGLYERANIANDINAEIFISIHFNAANADTATGIEVLYASEDDVGIKSGDQRILAQMILDELIESTGEVDRGIKNRPDLAVLNKTKMEAALVELGFISSPKDLDTIQSNGYLDTLSEAICKGIIKYSDKYL